MQPPVLAASQRAKLDARTAEFDAACVRAMDCLLPNAAGEGLYAAGAQVGEQLGLTYDAGGEIGGEVARCPHIPMVPSLGAQSVWHENLVERPAVLRTFIP